EKYRVGDEIEARYKGRTRWFKGKIRMTHRDGTYDIRYEDGDSEEAVEAKMIRRVGGGDKDRKSLRTQASDGSDLAAVKLYRVGDTVEARFRGRSRWFKGKIKKCNNDGTYDIRYEDGDHENGVEASLIRGVGGGSRGRLVDSDDSRSIASKVYRIGDKIEARYRGKGSWLRGTITFAHRNDTYDIRYEDGDTEKNVSTSNIRSDGEASRASLNSMASSDAGNFDVGDEIEARFKGRSRWFKGTITCKNTDGTYDIRYEDGDSERGVERELVRKTEGRRAISGLDDESDYRKRRENGHSKKLRLTIGEDVEARFKGGRRWLDGVVRRVNMDGTYDIRYEDGETERRVEPDLVRSKSRSQINRSGSDASDVEAEKYRVGDEIEARYKGRTRW
ncbi:unnamed protein product, partial [Chrysoparadoxa australica]